MRKFNIKRFSAGILLLAFTSVAFIRCSPLASSVSKHSTDKKEDVAGKASEVFPKDLGPKELITPPSPSPSPSPSVTEKKEIHVLIYRDRILDREAYEAEISEIPKKSKLVRLSKEEISEFRKTGTVEFKTTSKKLPLEAISLLKLDLSSVESRSEDLSKLSIQLSSKSLNTWVLTLVSKNDPETLEKIKKKISEVSVLFHFDKKKEIKSENTSNQGAEEYPAMEEEEEHPEAAPSPSPSPVPATN